MSHYADRKEAHKNAEASRMAEAQRLAALAYECFSTPAGTELLHHFIHKYGLTTRTFIPGESATVCPYRAAIRDGERAPVSYIIHLLRTHKPDHPIPL